MSTRAQNGGRLGLLRRMGTGLAVLALAIGMAATAAGPANALSPAKALSPANAPSPAKAPSPASTATPVSATAAATPSGSIVYVAANNVWLMAPDGSGKKQITHDGTTASPYYSPTEANDGTVAALRTNSAGDVSTVYVMNRSGQVMDRFAPPQYAYHGLGSPCSVDYLVAPTGIQRATISPDGLHVAYTARAMFQPIGCDNPVDVYTSYVVGRTGSGAVHLVDIEGLDVSEVGGWSDSATILLSNSAFEQTKLYTVSIPANHATLWKSDSDAFDTAWEGPSRGGTLLATSGFSDNAGADVVRLWNAPSLASAPTVRCEITATAGTTDPDVLGEPQAWPVSVAPNGSGVTWSEVNGDSTHNSPDEGVYVATVPSTGCPTSKTLIASGGSYPFWGSAAVSATGPVNTAPVVTVTAKPATYLRSTSASISYKVSDTTDYSVSTTCTLDAKAISCASPKALTGLAQGKHTFVITAKDPEGAHGSATVTWTVDTGLPTISVTTPAAVTLGTSVAFHWIGADHVSGVASYDVEYTAASYTGNFSTWVVKYAGTTATSWTLAGLRAGYEYCIRVRTHDKAGNVSAYSPARCTTHPMDDRALKASSYWTKPAISYAYTKTESDAAHLGATLTLANAHVAHLAVLATVTTVGGSVAVYVGSTKIGSVSLKASVGHGQQVLWLPTVSLRTGTVTLKSLTAAQVRIDGLVDLRTP